MASSSSATTGVSGRSAVISGSSDSASVGGGGVMSAEGGRITVSVHTTTGGRMQLELQPQCSVASLKRTLSARLRLAKDRIVLLHRNRQLKDGTLDSNNVRDGERLTLLPSVETGIQTVRPEQSVMQALESLSDAQVDNFLCGRAPLHLTMRLGDHVMFVQLQLCPPADTPPATPTTPGCPAPPQPPPPAAPTESLPGAGGAVIDHLRHLGQGVYSGSFSGTLGPELQDGDGRPRRHVATILHILRDLLGASQGWKGAGPSPAPPTGHTPRDASHIPAPRRTTPTAPRRTPASAGQARPDQGDAPRTPEGTTAAPAVPDTNRIIGVFCLRRTSPCVRPQMDLSPFKALNEPIQFRGLY